MNALKVAGNPHKLLNAIAPRASGDGELGYWRADGKIYRSKANGTVWTPAQYPDAWEVMGGENNT